MEGRGRVSGLKKGRCPWGKGGRRVSVVRRGGKINVSVVRGDKGLFSLIYCIPLLSHSRTSVLREIGRASCRERV